MNGDFREDLKRACEVMQKGGVILILLILFGE